MKYAVITNFGSFNANEGFVYAVFDTPEEAREAEQEDMGHLPDGTPITPSRAVRVPDDDPILHGGRLFEDMAHHYDHVDDP